MSGLFITFEGTDGTGKSTQIQRLKTALEAARIPVLCTREPGGTPFAEQLRDCVKHFHSDTETMTPETELMLFAASRSQHVCHVIRPFLAQNGVVLCDRFCDSTLTYQGYGRGLDKAFIRTLNAFVTGNLVPDRTVLFDLPPEVGLRRTCVRGEKTDRLEAAGVTLQEKVRAGYLTEAQADPGRFIVLNAQETPDAVFNALYRALTPLLRTRYPNKGI